MANLFDPPTAAELGTVAMPQRSDTPSPAGGGGGSNDTNSLFAPPPPGIGTPTPADPLFAPPGVDTPEYTRLRSEMDRSVVEGITKSPALVGKPVEYSDIQEIARKHGVSPDELEKWQYFLGASLPPKGASVSDIAERGAGIAGQALGFGVPQKIAKTIQDPKLEAALDDLQDLARARSSLAETAVTALAGPSSVVGTVGKGVAKGLAAGAATGAVSGIAASRSGQELEGATIGAGIGGALGSVGGYLARTSQKPLNQVEQEAISQVEKRGGADLRAGIQREVESHSDADRIIIERVMNPTGGLPEPDARRIVDQYRPGLLEKLVDDESPEGRIFRRRAQARLPEGANITPELLERIAVRDVAQEVIDEAAVDMASDVLKRQVSRSENPSELIRRWAGEGTEASGQGIEYARSRMADMLNSKHALRHISNSGAVDTGGAGLGERAADWISDAQYVIRGIDEKFPGLGLEDAHKRIVAGTNQLTFPREAMRQEIRDIFRKNRGTPLDQTARNAGDLIQRVESGLPLSSEQQAVYQPFRAFWDKQLSSINRLAEESGLPPLNIKNTPNYIPSQLMDSGKLGDVMSRRIQSLMDDASRLSLTPRKYSDVSEVPARVLERLVAQSPEHQSTLQFLRTISGQAADTPAAISRAFKESFLSRNGANRMETIARAALERDDAIPHWARETDLYRLADKWVNNTLRHIYLRQGLDQMRQKLVQLQKLGDQNAVKYVENLLQDLTGIRKGTAAEYANIIRNRFLSYMDRKISDTPEGSLKRGALETVRSLPAALQTLAAQVYPNLLGGANPRTVIMNATQTFTKTLPELGPEYGPLLFLRGAARVRNVRNMGKYKQRMQKLGLAPDKYGVASKEFLSEGLMRTSLGQKPASYLRGVANVGMMPYEFMENANRSIAFGAAEMMAHDLLPEAGGRASQMAQRALSRFPTSVRDQAQAAIQRGDRGGLTKTLATHIINNTQYQYNRASMSEFGRTMGPLFSTFSKWPTATFGQVVESYRSRGIPAATVKLGQELMAPLALLELADYAMGQYSDEGLSDRQKKLVGQGGLSQAAPIGNLSAILSGDFFTPPAIDTALKAVVHPLQQLKRGEDGNPFSGLQKGLVDGLYMFAPGGLGGWIRFITDDAVTLYSGERPEGSNFLERTASGIEELSR